MTSNGVEPILDGSSVQEKSTRAVGGADCSLSVNSEPTHCRYELADTGCGMVFLRIEEEDCNTNLT